MIWRFLHIVCMVGAVAVAVGGDLFRNAILRRGEAQAIRHAFAVERRLGNWVFFPLFLAGAAFGVVAALRFAWDLTAPWLLVSYGLVVAVFVNGLAYMEPHTRRMAAAAERDDEISISQLHELIHSPRTWLASGINLALWLALLFTMTFRPLGG
jgi:uncharacterized membrane protein